MKKKPIRFNLTNKFEAPTAVDWLQQITSVGVVGFSPQQVSGAGSSYYAAELRQDVDYANQVAREMGLEFRFKQI